MLVGSKSEVGEDVVVGGQVAGGVALADQRKAFDHGVFWVDYPAAGVGMEHGAMVLVKEVHGLFFTTTGEFGAGSPGYQGDEDGMGVLCKVPRVVEDASLLAVVVLQLLSDADSLREEAWVVGKVEGAGEKTALL